MSNIRVSPSHQQGHLINEQDQTDGVPDLIQVPTCVLRGHVLEEILFWFRSNPKQFTVTEITNEKVVIRFGGAVSDRFVMCRIREEDQPVTYVFTPEPRDKCSTLGSIIELIHLIYESDPNSCSSEAAEQIRTEKGIKPEINL